MVIYNAVVNSFLFFSYIGENVYKLCGWMNLFFCFSI